MHGLNCVYMSLLCNFAGHLLIPRGFVRHEREGRGDFEDANFGFTVAAVAAMGAKLVVAVFEQ
jgi:hypothetical protein